MIARVRAPMLLVNVSHIPPEGLDLDLGLTPQDVHLEEDIGFQLEEGAELDCHIDRGEDWSVHVQGRLKARLSMECGRCLDPVALVLDQGLDLYFLRGGAQQGGRGRGRSRTHRPRPGAGLLRRRGAGSGAHATRAVHPGPAAQGALQRNVSRSVPQLRLQPQSRELRLCSARGRPASRAAAFAARSKRELMTRTRPAFQC